jgi:H+/Cl- antiporter ClcA
MPILQFHPPPYTYPMFIACVIAAYVLLAILLINVETRMDLWFLVLGLAVGGFVGLCAALYDHWRKK